MDLAEFEDFVKLVQEMGFMMIVRPGPYICAEWERGGFPSWVAAKRFPLRTNDPQSLQTSQHWYSAVLPIIMQHQVTLGGPIIMVQVENEYDFSPPMPDDRQARIHSRPGQDGVERRHQRAGHHVLDKAGA